MKYIYTSLFFVLILLSFSASAQELRITSSLTLGPVSEVAVFNNTMGYSSLTNENGVVVLKGFKQQDTVHIQHPSYYDVSLTYKQLAAQDFQLSLDDKIVLLNEYVVSVSKTKERADNVATKVDVIRQNQITFSNAQTTADVLESTGNVFIQKSQMGGGSPVIRGFEANKVLIVVDGVRMNNAIYRSGHLQNVITIDDAVLDRTEVVFGPGSLIYGSDALGGVMHFYTRKPQLGAKDSVNIKTSAYGRFASANLERTGHFDFNIGLANIASFSSFTFSDYGDSRIGANQNDFYGNHGKRYEYVETINGIDRYIENDDPLVQKFTGYHQLDLLQKFLIPISNDLDLTLNYQFSTSSNIPRYDKLRETTLGLVTDTIGIIVGPTGVTPLDTTYEKGLLSYAQWDYGPQKRHFASASLDLKTPKSLYDDGSIIVAYQNIHEERITRRFGRSDRTHRLEEVNAFTLNIDMNKKVSNQQTIQYGFEGVFNDVASSAFTIDVSNGDIDAASTRYPEGGSTMQTYAAYIKYNINISNRLFITPGFRYSQIFLNSKFDDTDFFTFDFNEIEINTSAFSGSFGVVAKPTETLKLNFLMSSGYRAPNVDDVGKVFDPNPGQVVVPNENLQPEFAYNFEIGITQTFAGRIQVNALFFNTLLKNAILREVYNYNNNDSILYDGVLSQVYANVNVGSAVIRGVSVSVKADLNHHLSLMSTFNYTYGRDETNDVPLAHIPPIFGQTALMYTQGRFKSEFSVRYNGWKHLEDYAPSGADNLADATELGTPAWYTLNLRTAYQFNEYFRLQFAIDNLLDQHYRPFSSGVSAPGRNFIIMAKVSF